MFNKAHHRRKCQRKLKRKGSFHRCERCGQQARLNVRFDAIDLLNWVVHKSCDNGHVTEYWPDGRRWVGNLNPSCGVTTGVFITG